MNDNVLMENDLASSRRFFAHPAITRGTSDTPPRNAVCSGDRSFVSPGNPYYRKLDDAMSFRIMPSLFDKQFSADIGTLKQPDVALDGTGCKTSQPSTFWDIGQIPTTTDYLERWTGVADARIGPTSLRKCPAECISSKEMETETG